MNWNLQNDNINSLVLIAHPDDETIFCGGTMLQYPTWNWTIVCVTMQFDTPRPDEFKHAVDMYRSYGVNVVFSETLGQKDNGHELGQEEFQQWKTLINNLSQKPDIVFTHNKEGDYGHPHHRAINKIANELFSNVWEFICPGAINVNPQPYRNKFNKVELSKEILDRKFEIFDKSYVTQFGYWKDIPDIMQYEFKSGSPEIFTTD